jgi:hypothetical protein
LLVHEGNSRNWKLKWEKLHLDAVELLELEAEVRKCDLNFKWINSFLKEIKMGIKV